MYKESNKHINNNLDQLLSFNCKCKDKTISVGSIRTFDSITVFKGGKRFSFSLHNTEMEPKWGSPPTFKIHRGAKFMLDTTWS